MSFDLDLQAVRTTAKKQLAPPCYPANAAKAANTANALQLPKVSSISRISSVSTLAGGAAKDPQAPEISSVSNISRVSRVAGGTANVVLPVPQSKWSVYAPWRAADRAYQTHHWQCATCRAAARSAGHSTRCAAGQQLYAAYEQAAPAGGTV